MNTSQLLSPYTSPSSVKSYLRSFFKGERTYLWACFLLPMLIMWIIYICMEVFPFGEESVLVLDLNGQYVYFFEELKNILQGDGSLLYTFSRAMGGEFFGIFAYYLSSPFSFIVALFPDAYITEALLIMFLLKTACCGFTFGIYIDSTRDRNPVATVIFSSMYALCGYAVVMQHNTMWIDNLILLPVIMLSIEQMIKFGKYKTFVISLAMAIFSNFYIGYMSCIFVAVYFFYYYFSCSEAERNPMQRKNHFIKSLGTIGVFSLITLLICAALLLCTYYSLGFGKTEFSNPTYELTQRFDWLDMISKFYFGSYDTVRPEGLPWLYCGMLALILAPLYFFAPHVKTREKIATGILILFFLLSFNASTLDLIWHGFQKPNWLNYRYSFILCFIIILMAYKAYEKILQIGYRKVMGSCAAAAGILLVLQKLELKNVDDMKTVWCSLIIIAVYLAVFRAATMPDKELRKTTALILAILCTLELFCAGLLNVIALDKDVVYSSRTSYQSFRKRVDPIADLINEKDDSFFRMEKTVHRKTNDPFMLDMNGFSGSTSTLNRETITLLNRMGLSSKSHWTKYLGGTPVFDSLFGIKYLICEKNDPQPLYEFYVSHNDDLVAYKNNYALPIAYGVNADIRGFDMGSSQYSSPFTRMNAMVSSMLGSEDTLQLFKPAAVSDLNTVNLISSTVAGHHKYAPEDHELDSTVTYTIEITDSDTLYCYFPSDYTREVDLFLNGSQLGTYYGNETYRIVELGSFNPGQVITVTMELQDDVLYIKENEDYFCYLDSEAFTKHMSELGDSPFEITEYTESYFEGTIDMAEDDSVVFTSIAYDEGWKVILDGKETETFKLIDGTIGFKASPGSHTLIMKYRPDCLLQGILLQALGILLFAAAWILEIFYRKKQLKAGASVFIPEAAKELCLPDEAAFKQSEPSCEAEAKAKAKEGAETPPSDNKGDNT